jgi:S-methylmethionine-dependent homocysteine/selenocysteine methylase
LTSHGAPGGLNGYSKAFREGDTIEENEELGYNVSRFLNSVAPAAMAEFAVKAKAEGISFIGCCCGAGPMHIRAMARALGIQPEAN